MIRKLSELIIIYHIYQMFNTKKSKTNYLQAIMHPMSPKQCKSTARVRIVIIIIITGIIITVIIIIIIITVIISVIILTIVIVIIIMTCRWSFLPSGCLVHWPPCPWVLPTPMIRCQCHLRCCLTYHNCWHNDCIWIEALVIFIKFTWMWVIYLTIERCLRIRSYHVKGFG